MNMKIHSAMEKYERFIDKSLMINKVFFRFMCFCFALMTIAWIGSTWYAYDLKKENNLLTVDRADLVDTLEAWKHSNQMMAGQLKQKHEYIEELLQRLRQFQDEIEIVELREENDG
jgi:hypothetical protein